MSLFFVWSFFAITVRFVQICNKKQKKNENNQQIKMSKLTIIRMCCRKLDIIRHKKKLQAICIL